MLGTGMTVVAILQSEDWPVACVISRELSGHVICFRATCCEENTIDIFRQSFYQILGIKALLVIKIDGGVVLDLAQGLDDFRVYSRMAMANTNSRDTRAAIKVSFSCLVIKVLHISLN
jgi:hypothetical protein